MSRHGHSLRLLPQPPWQHHPLRCVRSMHDPTTLSRHSEPPPRLHRRPRSGLLRRTYSPLLTPHSTTISTSHHNVYTPYPLTQFLPSPQEFVGYIGRILMHSNPWSQSYFDIQICCLVLSPSFLAAGIYLALKHLVLHFGPSNSRLPPNLYPPIFIGCDVVSILMQAAGGGTAASETASLVTVGDKIIVAGIAFQVATMSVCAISGVDFAVRTWAQRRKEGRSVLEGERKGFEFYLACTTVAFVTIYIRCIYRYV